MKVMPSHRNLWLCIALVWLCGPQILAAPGDGHWDRQFGAPGTGTRNLVLRLNGNKLYTAGYDLVGGQIVGSLVNVYDGTNWSEIGEIGFTGSLAAAYELGWLGSDLYVGGLFNTAGKNPASGLAKWDGRAWSAVGGFTGLVATMTSDGTNLYVGGSFTNVGGTLSTNIARWDGTNWSAVGGGVGDFSAGVFTVRVLQWRDGRLYAGGYFTSAGGLGATNLARWDGVSWTQVGGGVNGAVSSLHFAGADLYVGGRFTQAGPIPALNIAKWNGSAWSALGSGLKAAPGGNVAVGIVGSLATLGPDLYAGGSFTNAGGVTASGIAKWDGSNWHAVGTLNGGTWCLVSNAGAIYIGGDFNIAHYNTPTNVIGNHIIRWDGVNWHGVPGKGGKGTHLFVQALALGSDGLYMGGLFNAVAETVARRIARWDGTNWFALGSGVDGEYNGNTLAVRSIAARGNELFVGGAFVTAGGSTANNISKWDGANWSTLGFGVDSTVSAIDTTSADVYVGGSFTNAFDAPFTGYTVNRVARWDPATGWWPLGSGVNGSVNTICVQGGSVYVGGAFTAASGVTANRIAVWNGANWASLGTGTANGLGGSVNDILVDGSDVYVGGSFTTAGGTPARAIAKWNGSSWSALGQGMFYTSAASVSGLAKIGNYLYATGAFTNAGGGLITKGIARWDGVKWESLGSGIGNEGTSRGTALAVWGDDLFVGGIFETAGVCDAGFIARWNDQIDFSSPSAIRLSNPQMLAGNNFKFRVSSSERASYAIDYSSNYTDWTAFRSNGGFFVDYTNSLPAGENFRVYRSRHVP